MSPSLNSARYITAVGGSQGNDSIVSALTKCDVRTIVMFMRQTTADIMAGNEYMWIALTKVFRGTLLNDLTILAHPYSCAAQHLSDSEPPRLVAQQLCTSISLLSVIGCCCYVVVTNHDLKHVWYCEVIFHFFSTASPWSFLFIIVCYLLYAASVQNLSNKLQYLQDCVC